MRRHRLAMLALSLILVCAMTACKGGTNLSGKVYSSKGLCIADAEIELSVLKRNGEIAGTWKARTDQGGEFTLIAGPHAPLHTKISVKVSKEGFKPYVTVLRSSKHLGGMFVLSECGEPGDSSGAVQKL